MPNSKNNPTSIHPQLDIFERLLAGETILPNDPQMHRLRDESFAVRKLLIKMNNSSDSEEVTKILSEILDQEIQNVAVFTPIYINYGKHVNIGKNVFINFDCTFLALGGITIEDDVLIGPKVSLITENHPLDPKLRNGLIGKAIHIKKTHGLVQMQPFCLALQLAKILWLQPEQSFQKMYLTIQLSVEFLQRLLKK